MTINESPMPKEYWSAPAAAAAAPFAPAARPTMGQNQTRKPVAHKSGAAPQGSKEHLTRSVGGLGQSQSVPTEVREIYQQMFPDWTQQQIESDYLKHK